MLLAQGLQDGLIKGACLFAVVGQLDRTVRGAHQGFANGRVVRANAVEHFTACGVGAKIDAHIVRPAIHRLEAMQGQALGVERLRAAQVKPFESPGGPHGLHGLVGHVLQAPRHLPVMHLLEFAARGVVHQLLRNVGRQPAFHTLQQLHMTIRGFFEFIVAIAEKGQWVGQGLLALGVVGLFNQGTDVAVDFQALDRVGQQGWRSLVFDVGLAQHIVVEAADAQDLLALDAAEPLDAVAKAAHYGVAVPRQRIVKQGLPSAMTVVPQRRLESIGTVGVFDLVMPGLAVRFCGVQFVFMAQQGFVLMVIQTQLIGLGRTR
ncbi:hypothetical protein D3C73_685160 [compost metagenome]